MTTICDALVQFVQFKTRDVALKVTLLHGCFSRFLNCTNGTKYRNALYYVQNRHKKSMTSKTILGDFRGDVFLPNISNGTKKLHHRCLPVS